MGFKQHISRTWQMIEQQVNDVPFRPDYETIGLKFIKPKNSIGLTKNSIERQCRSFFMQNFYKNTVDII
jgi:hypothetical protein